MNNFETMLLKTGSTDLICEFINNYDEIISADFKEALQNYVKETELKLVDAFAHKPTEVLDMSICDFFTEPSDKRIIKLLHRKGIETVRDLIHCDYHDLRCITGFGKKALRRVIRALGDKDLKLMRRDPDCVETYYLLMKSIR